MREIMIIVHVHALYQTLLSCIQLIFVLLIFRYVKKFLEFKSNEDSNRICKEMNDEKRLIIQDLYNDLVMMSNHQLDLKHKSSIS